MTNWKKVFGTEETKPEEYDTKSSPTTVYQRRNVTQVTREDNDKKKVTGWEREERELTVSEYEQMLLMQEIVASSSSTIVTTVTDFQKATAIDEYTAQLIEEGVL